MTSSEDPALLFEWLTDVHERWGWTQTRFAELIGKTPSGMRRWNEGAYPANGTLRAVARAVGVSQDDLRAVMRGEDVPVPPPPGDATPGPTPNVDRRVELLTDLVLQLQHEVRELQREFRERSR
jgi:transcriptional regulator with XRE-family HTH domain